MRLLPKTAKFFDELDRHAALLSEAGRLLVEMTRSPENNSDRARRIKGIERECDEIAHSVILELHKTFITPLDRLDTHDVFSRLDDVTDAVEQSAYCLTRYTNGSMPKEVVQLAEIVADAVQQVAQGVGRLKEIKQGEQLLECCRAIRVLEGQADEISRERVARLFEDVRDAPTLLRWKEIYEALEEVTDRCNDVADVLENVVLDNA
jgi:predicted phosphate transport protein (TIGR00153 family)